MGERINGGVVVLCTDPRLEKANLWKYIKQSLITEEQRWAPVGLFGAPVALARPHDLPVKFAAVMEDVVFALEEFAEPKFMVVGHDCGIYSRIEAREFTLEEKMADIARAAAFLRKRFPSAPVTAYFKKVGPGFDTVPF